MPSFAELEAQMMAARPKRSFADLEREMVASQPTPFPHELLAMNPALDAPPQDATGVQIPTAPLFAHEDMVAQLDRPEDRTPTIGAPPRTEFQIPPPSATTRILEPLIAGSGELVSGATAGLADPILNAINPEFERIKRENPGFALAGNLIGTGGTLIKGIGALKAALPKLGPVAADALGFGTFEGIRQRDPKGFVEGAAIGGAFGLVSKAISGAAKGIKKAAVAQGGARLRGSKPVKPTLRAPTSSVAEASGIGKDEGRSL